MNSVNKSILLILGLLAIVNLAGAQELKGRASFYANKFHGRSTASGVKYDKDALTAAHRTLAFGTRLKVVNPQNGKQVLVTVNDRGPFVKGRILDLSRAAAIQLDIIDEGVAPVEITILDEKGNPAVAEAEPEIELPEGDGLYKVEFASQNLEGRFGVQVQSFGDFDNVLVKLQELKEQWFSQVHVSVATVEEQRVYRIIIGNFDSRTRAEAYQKELLKKNMDGFVIAF